MILKTIWQIPRMAEVWIIDSTAIMGKEVRKLIRARCLGSHFKPEDL